MVFTAATRKSYLWKKKRKIITLSNSLLYYLAVKRILYQDV